MLIKCTSEKNKWEIIKGTGTKDIKYFDNNNVSHLISFRPDLTIKQRDLRRKRIKELNQHKENGEADLIIKNNCMIKKTDVEPRCSSAGHSSLNNSVSDANSPHCLTIVYHLTIL